MTILLCQQNSGNLKDMFTVHELNPDPFFSSADPGSGSASKLKDPKRKQGTGKYTDELILLTFSRSRNKGKGEQGEHGEQGGKY